MEKYSLPNWVFKRDGRLAPFEADKISQALFAATESQGCPNAFLARELTDGVLHFLGRETEGDNPSTEQIAEIVTKVTRELGHPELARAFLAARGATNSQEQSAIPTRMAAAPSPKSPSAAERPIFTRDLLSALENGLLELGENATAAAVDGLVVEPSGMGHSWGESLLDEIVRLRTEVGRFFILDSPDHLIAASDAPGWMRQLCRLLEAVDRHAIVNLHIAAAPAWSREGGVGPLFSERSGTVEKSSPVDVAQAMLEALAAPIGRERVTINWHLDEKTLVTDNIEAERGISIPADRRRWTLDRTGQAISLGQGVDRDHGCVLVEIGLNLRRFFEIDGVEGRLDAFLEKLPSLANMAISAGAQKRAFLSRIHAANPARLTRLAQGFLLYRARAAIVPVGLDEVVRLALGRNASESKPAQELEQRILKTIQASATRHGRARNLDVVIPQEPRTE